MKTVALIPRHASAILTALQFWRKNNMPTWEYSPLTYKEVERIQDIIECAPEAFQLGNTLETILDKILEHDKKNPDHGVGCVCMDQHAGTLRRLLVEKKFTWQDNPKSVRNLLIILSYLQNCR